MAPPCSIMPTELSWLGKSATKLEDIRSRLQAQSLSRPWLRRRLRLACVGIRLIRSNVRKPSLRGRAVEERKEKRESIASVLVVMSRAGDIGRHGKWRKSMLVNENVGSPVVSAPGLILRRSRDIEGAQGGFVIRSVVVDM
jgi:hypothetical protein